MQLTITNVVARGGVGNDVLDITAADDDGNTYPATGWVTATTNHYDADAYDTDGNLVEGAKPRAMTPDEVGAYALTRLLEQHPELASRVPNQQPAPEPVPVDFTAPAVELAPVPADDAAS